MNSKHTQSKKRATLEDNGNDDYEPVMCMVEDHRGVAELAEESSSDGENIVLA